jgi:hypothetical protein
MCSTTFFKKAIIIFWAIWWVIASWTDIIGGLAHLGILHASWAPDTNYPFLVESLKMYHLKPWIPTIAFIGIITWSTASTLAFIFASFSLVRDEQVWLPRAEFAFILSLTYWMTFFLADQIVMKYDLEQNHMIQGGFELLTLLALYIIPKR